MPVTHLMLINTFLLTEVLRRDSKDAREVACLIPVDGVQLSGQLRLHDYSQNDYHKYFN